MHDIYTYARLNDLGLGARSHGSAEKKNHISIVSTTKQAIRIKLAATVGHDHFYSSTSVRNLQ